MTRQPQLLPRGHPDRATSAEEVVEPYYQALVLRMLSKGLSDEETALAVESLAQAHLDMLRANDATELDIDHARRMAGMPERVPAQPPAPAPVWPSVASGAILAATSIFIITWIL